MNRPSSSSWHRPARCIRLNGRELAVVDAYDGQRIALDRLEASNELVVEAECDYTESGEGVHRSVDPEDGQTYLFSECFLYEAQRTFACFDQPDLKASFTLHMVVPEGWIALSNGAGTETSPGHWTFEPTPPLPTYLVGVNAGPYETVRSVHGDLPLDLHCRRSMTRYLESDDILADARIALDFMGDMFGRPYPFSKLDLLFVPEVGGAMENAACITFSDDFLFRSPVTDTRRRDRTDVICHEIAHMWFGDLVTMAMVGRPVAERVVRLVPVHAHDGHGHPTRDRVDDLRPDGEGVGLLGGSTPDDAPDLLGCPRRARDDAQHGRDLLREGGRHAEAARGVGRPRAVPPRPAALHQGQRVREHVDPGPARRAGGRQRSGSSSMGARVAADRGRLDSRVGADRRRPRACRLVRDPPVGTASQPDASLASNRRSGPSTAMARGWRAHRGSRSTSSAPRTDIPDLVGRSVPDLIVLNDDDLTWARTRLDDRSLRAVLDGAIPSIDEPLTRAVLWLALREMTLDAILPVSNYVRIVLDALPSEPEITMVEDLQRRTLTAITRLGDPARREERLGALADRSIGWLEVAPAGSDTQLAHARALARSAVDDRHVALLADWLSGRRVPEGLTIGPALRWEIVGRLAVIGRVGGAAIDVE